MKVIPSNFFNDVSRAGCKSNIKPEEVSINFNSGVIAMTRLSFKTLTVATGVASLAALYSVSALADDIGYPFKPDVFQSSKTRDEVRAEYFKAVKDGTLPQIGEGSAAVTTAASSSNLTREAVLADTVEWLRVHRNDIVMGGN
jgi:Domain of unknown function (DUF4148)